MRQQPLLQSIIYCLLSLACFVAIVNGFTQQTPFSTGCAHRLTPKRSKSTLYGSVFDDWKQFWEGNMGNSGKNSTDYQLEETTTADAAGTALITSIPVRAMKRGGLRLFLMFYLMGQQNMPDKNSWRANQPSSEEYFLEMFYHDATGMISIELFEDEIRISRCGSVPSTAYLMQESVIVQ